MRGTVIRPLFVCRDGHALVHGWENIYLYGIISVLRLTVANYFDILYVGKKPLIQE